MDEREAYLYEYQNVIDILAEMVAGYVAKQLKQSKGEESNE